MTILIGDCREVMATMDAASVDAVVTDPPYDLTANKKGGSGAASVNLDSPYGRARIGTGNGGGFMGKDWDATGVAFDPATWEAALRVLKPGGHLLAFGGDRTIHRMICAIEDAGFEIRHQIAWIHGQGFPKNHDFAALPGVAPRQPRPEFVGTPYEGGGFGTALKPAMELIVLARKPLAGTVAANVAAHGTGALNIDACRIQFVSDDDRREAEAKNQHTQFANPGSNRDSYSGDFPPRTDYDGSKGRWPANVCLDEAAAALLDEQSGERAPGHHPKQRNGRSMWANEGGGLNGNSGPERWLDRGGASRYFFVATKDSYCWLCNGQKHGIMNATQEEAACVHANNADSLSSRLDPLNGSAPDPALPEQLPSSGAKSGESPARVRNAEPPSRTMPGTDGSIVPTNAPEPHVARLARSVKSAGDLCDSCGTAIAQSLAAMLRGQTPASLPGLGSMPSSNASILTRNLALFAEPWASTGTIPTTANLSILFGSVRHAIAESISKASPARNIESGPTRFLYQSKASRSERNAGLEGMPEHEARPLGLSNWAGQTNGSGETMGPSAPQANNHPTVKPIALMRWLVRLVTPPGGLVLDPFAGSGSTGVACAHEGFRFLGIEQDESYAEIARRRIFAAAPLFTEMAAD